MRVTNNELIIVKTKELV